MRAVYIHKEILTKPGFSGPGEVGTVFALVNTLTFKKCNEINDLRRRGPPPLSA